MDVAYGSGPRPRGPFARLAMRRAREPEGRPGANGLAGPAGGSGPPGSAGFGTALALAMGVGPLATYGISALGPLVTEGLGLSRTGLGSVATVTFVAAALASVLVGRAADVFRARVVMAALFIGAGCALLAVSAAPSYAWLLVAVAVSGCFQALSNPVTNQLISANVPEGRRGVLMGVKQSGVQMSQFGAGLALPSVALLLGWRGAAAVSSVVAVAGLVLVRTSVPQAARTPRGPGRRRADRRLPEAVWWLCGYGFLTGAALQAMNVYLPLFGYERLDMTVTAAGLSAAVVGGVGLAARMYWGRVADRMRRPHFLLALLAAVSAGAALCLTVSALTGAAWTMWLAAVLFGASGIAVNVVVMLAVVQVSDLSVVGAASGVLAFGQYLGFAVGPVSLGAAVDRLGAYTTGWASVAAVYAAAAVLALLWRCRDGPLGDRGRTGAVTSTNIAPELPRERPRASQSGRTSMLTKEKNELLVRTGPGTPMGELFRRYWIPALLAEEIPEPDCPPVRVKLLGEELIAFRDTEGRIGLLDEFCAHRTASLFFGRNEECGLRCSYHGWKFDVEGNCVDMPSEPETSTFKNRVKLKAYPCVELAGVIWTYMGPPELRPALPELEWVTLDADRRFVSKRWQESNYLQAMEGGIDSSHVSFAHRYNIDNDPMHAGTEGLKYLKADTRPKFEVAESDGGLVIGARRFVDEKSYYWRITQWIMPWYTIIPPFGTHNPLGGHAWVPIDDENCWAWSINYHPTRALTERELASMEAGEGIHVKYIPGTYRPLANRTNDYLIDRRAQKERRSFSGVEGISAQDFSLQESMGRIVDRSKERLGTSDAAIILARRRLLDALKLLDGPGPLPGAEPEHQRVRSASLVLPDSVPFQEGARDALVVVPGQDFVSI